MIATIVVMHLFILLMIQRSWLVSPPTLPIPWMEGNSELRMTGAVVDWLPLMKIVIATS
jgi:hypothetical protein